VYSKENRALRNYSIVNGIKDVTLDVVKDSQLGVAGLP
jgi:hypothetical protein